MQMGLFGLENRYASLSGLGDPLERLNDTVDWEIFRPDLKRIDQKVRKSAACRAPASARRSSERELDTRLLSVCAGDYHIDRGGHRPVEGKCNDILSTALGWDGDGPRR